MTSTPVPAGYYRIRKAGAKSVIANSISQGKKCHYVQIGIELSSFDNLEDAQAFVEGKGLIADAMSLDFGVEPSKPADSDEPAAEVETVAENEADGESDADDDDADDGDGDENVASA